ncbi:MAG TPA: hypothetical protein VIX42_12190 [Edaphobacter sp.]
MTHIETAKPSVASSAPLVYRVGDESSSVIYVRLAGATEVHRLTANKRVWESDPVLSANGELIAYAIADGPEARSEVWVAHIDGSHAHRVSGAEEDAIMPAFAPDGKTLLYVKSRFNGHYSPIARPRRHKFDVVKVIVDADGPVAGASPVELTQQNFFDMHSLSVSPDGEHFLLSTSGYPIGSLIEEFEIANPLEIHKIFQPHVTSEPSTGASFGHAAYVHNGMDIVFTAATEGTGGMFDYNVYQMSDVTGGALIMLAKHTGMIDSLAATVDGTIYVTANNKRMVLDSQTKSLNPVN